MSLKNLRNKFEHDSDDIEVILNFRDAGFRGSLKVKHSMVSPDVSQILQVMDELVSISWVLSRSPETFG